MTIAEPIPDLQYGKGTWQDYISNWRTRDTNWMQERLILRYPSPAARTTDWPAPKAGQVTYNDTTGLLEMWSATKSAWLRSLMFQFLLSNKDDATGVNLYHSASGAKGVQLTPTSLLVDAPTTNWLNGVGVLDATGLALKVGAKTAKIATDTDNLTVDSPVKTPSIVADAATITGAVSAGSVSAASMTVTTSLTLTGATVSGGTINATGGTIGGITLSGGTVQSAAGAAGGMQSGQGHFYGDANSAVMRQRPAVGGTWGTSFVQAKQQSVLIGGVAGTDFFDINSTLRYYGGQGMRWFNAGGVHQAWISPVIYATSDPGAANFPDGTLWFS